MTHPMMPRPNHDETAEQLFVRDLKFFLRNEIDPIQQAIVAHREAAPGAVPAVADVRDALLAMEPVRAAIGLKRVSQEMMWDAVGASIDRQIDRLKALAVMPSPRGSLRLDAGLEIPAYIANWDTHMMPGGFSVDEGEGDIRQGALMDRGGAIYMLGRNGGEMNDGRGRMIHAHVAGCYPDFRPSRILELGCGVGNTACAVAAAYPDAQMHAVDLGAAVLRYAHARAEHLSIALHLSQQSAEATGYPDASFDLVFTSIVFHEISSPAIAAIIREQHRLLRPGGLAVNLDIAQSHASMTTWQKISGELDMQYNNEIGWKNATTADYPALYRAAGFDEALVGYQPMPVPGGPGFDTEVPGNGIFAYVTSAVKQAR